MRQRFKILSKVLIVIWFLVSGIGILAGLTIDLPEAAPKWKSFAEAVRGAIPLAWAYYSLYLGISALLLWALNSKQHKPASTRSEELDALGTRLEEFEKFLVSMPKQPDAMTPQLQLINRRLKNIEHKMLPASVLRNPSPAKNRVDCPYKSGKEVPYRGSLRPLIRHTAQELQDTIESKHGLTTVADRNLYTGKWLAVSGSIDKLEEKDTGSISMAIHSYHGRACPHILATFYQDQRKHVEHMAKGDEISFVGIINALDLSGFIFLEDCRLIVDGVDVGGS